MTEQKPSAPAHPEHGGTDAVPETEPAGAESRTSGREPAAEQPPAEPARARPALILRSLARIRLGSIGDGFATLRALILNAFLLFGVFAVILFTVAELRRQVVVIEPIRLAGPLSQMGYSEDVAAFRLWDDVMLINDSTPTAKDRVTLLPSSQQMDFEAPGAGISVQMVLRILRPFFGLDQTRITGEFLCTTEDCARESLALRLRVFRGGTMRIISLPTIGEETGGGDIDAYFHAAALELLRELDPYVVAFFLYQTDKAAAEREALQLVGPTHPQRKWALNLLGFIAADRGDYDEAIGFYQRAITADETEGFAIAHTNWGDALRAKGDYDEAIEHYQQALAIDPRHSVAYSGWANALADKGDMAAALEMHARAAEVDPESAFAYAHWGNALYTSGDLDGAIEKYSRATEIDPTYALGYYNWGVALEAKGDRDGAIAKYIRATELDPEDAGAITSWALVLRAKGDLDGALERFAQAAAIEPGNAFIFNNWGITLGAVGKLEMAIEKFKRAAVLDSDYSDAHFNLAVAYKLLERNAEAAAAFERYLALNPDAANAADVRAEIANLRAQIAGN